jgi:hypothetical protein
MPYPPVAGRFAWVRSLYLVVYCTAPAQERQQLLAQAANTGVITDYAGWRQGLKGRVFKIKGGCGGLGQAVQEGGHWGVATLPPLAAPNILV